MSRLNYVAQVVRTLVATGAHRATKYVGPKDVVRATRKLNRGKIGGYTLDIVLTIGQPNYRERKFIKACKKAGEPFPVAKVQLQAAPKPRAKKTRRRK